MGSKSGMKPSMRYGVLGQASSAEVWELLSCSTEGQHGAEPWAGSMFQPIHHMCSDAGGSQTGYQAMRSSFVLLAVF